MKQTITFDQLNELSPEAIKKLQQYFNRDLITKKPIPEKYWWSVSPSQLSIGEMIEFLTNNGKNFSMGYDRNPDMWTFVSGKWWANSKGEIKDGQEYPELCDALWEAVKEVLEQKERYG